MMFLLLVKLFTDESDSVQNLYASFEWYYSEFGYTLSLLEWSFNFILGCTNAVVASAHCLLGIIGSTQLVFLGVDGTSTPKRLM